MSFFKTICPYCGSEKTICVNWGQRLSADALGIGAGLVVGLFNHSMAGPAAINIRRNCCKNREYICLRCKREFSAVNN